MMHTFYIVGDSVKRGLIAEVLELEADKSSTVASAATLLGCGGASS